MEPLEFKKRPNSLVPVPFFALGLLGLLSLNVGVAADPGAITFPPNPQGILLLHLAVLGWVTPVMMGADYQLIPVVLHRPIGGQRAATAVLAVYAAGVLAFLLGWGAGRPTWIAAGGAAAGVALLGFAAHAGAALLRGPRLGPTALGLGGGLLFLVLTAVLGPWMALTIGGTATARFDRVLPLHAAAGLCGWLLLTIQGATYQLMAFFAATEPKVQPRFGGTAVVMVAAGAVLLLAAALVRGLPGVIGATVASIGLGLWAYDMARLAHHGRQARREPVVTYSLTAVGTILLAAAGAVAALFGAPHVIVAAAYLGIVVGPSLLILGQLQKILPFIASLEMSLAAKRRGRVPKTEALFPRGAAFGLLWAFGPGYAGLVVGLACGLPILTRVAAGLVALSAAAYIAQQSRALAAWWSARRPSI